MFHAILGKCLSGTVLLSSLVSSNSSCCYLPRHWNTNLFHVPCCSPSVQHLACSIIDDVLQHIHLFVTVPPPRLQIFSTFGFALFIFPKDVGSVWSFFFLHYCFSHRIRVFFHKQESIPCGLVAFDGTFVSGVRAVSASCLEPLQRRQRISNRKSFSKKRVNLFHLCLNQNQFESKKRVQWTTSHRCNLQSNVPCPLSTKNRCLWLIIKKSFVFHQKG